MIRVQRKIQIFSFKKNEFGFLKKASKFYSKHYIIFYEWKLKKSAKDIQKEIGKTNFKNQFQFSFVTKKKLRKAHSRNKQKRRMNAVVLDYFKNFYKDIQWYSIKMIVMEMSLDDQDYQSLKQEFYKYFFNIYKISNRKMNLKK